jgi:tetratricopeptide (TPR) repeat protein
MDWISAVLLAALIVSPGSTQEPDLTAAVGAARDLWANGDREGAIVGLRGAVGAAQAGAERGQAKELLADWLSEGVPSMEVVRLYAEAATEAPDRARDALPRLVRCQEALPPGPERVEALRLRAEVEGLAGDADAAQGSIEQALTGLDEALKAYRAAPEAHFYLKARREVDRSLTRAALHRQAAALYSARQEREVAVAAWEASLVAWPTDPETPSVCLQLSAALAETDRAKGLAYALRAADALGDRTAASTTAKNPENAAFLGGIAAPCDAARLQAILAALEAVARGGPGVALPGAEGREAFIAGWTAADGACHAGRFAEGLDAWRELRTQAAGSGLGWMAALVHGQWAYNCGRYVIADEALRSAATTASTAEAAALASYAWGHVAFAEGDLAAARARFEAACTTPDVGLAVLAALRLAETDEARGDADAAQAIYGRLAAQCPDEYPGRAAVTALARMAGRDLSALRLPREQRPAAYLGSDRETRGRWRIYGRDAFVLCGSNGYHDTCGGARWPLVFRGYLGTGDKVWFWTQLADADPSMLYNPTQRQSHPFNWDDGGEKQEVGTGPDLLLDVDVPAGLFRLSLYFVNDHNYYEPNREYTVYVLDGADPTQVLAACPVRDFVNGVYEHFAVVGPRRITVRILRNLSLNTLLQAVLLDEIGATPAWEGLAGLPPGPAPTAGGISAPTVGEALAIAAEAQGALVQAAPAERAAKAWSTFRTCRDAGCGRGTQEEWLRTWAAGVRASAPDAEATKRTGACAEGLCKAGFIGAAQIVDGLVYPLPHPEVSRRSVTVALAIADRYAEPIDYPQVVNRAEGIRTPIHVPLDDRTAQDYLAETLRRLWAEQPDRAEHLALMLADQYFGRQWLGMARRCYETVLGAEPDFSRLTPEQHRDYAFTLPEGAERIPVLEALLQRPELPGKEVVLRGHLLWSYLQADDMEHAEAEARRILSLEVPAGYKCYDVFQVATKYSVIGNPAKAAEWCHIVLERLPGSPVTPQAERLLRDMETSSTSKGGE